MPPLESMERQRQMQELQYKYAVACYALAFEILEMHWDQDTIRAFQDIMDDVPLDIKGKPQFKHLLLKKKKWIRKCKKKPKEKHGSA